MTHPILSKIQSRLQDIALYQPGKTIREIEREFGLKNVIKLASNECPLPPSLQVRAAIQNPNLITRYPEDAAPELRQHLAEKLGVQAKQITFGTGSSEVGEMVLRLFAEPGSELILAEREFKLYRTLGQTLGMTLRFIPELAYYQVDLTGMLEAITPKTCAIILANPNNPTGQYTPHLTLLDFISKVPSSVLVIIDEAYFEFMTQRDYASIIPYLDLYPNLVILRTFSKAYALAGLRFGYALSHIEIAEKLNRLRKPFNIPTLTLAAAHAALLDTTYVKQYCDYNAQALKQAAQQFRALGYSVIAETANFLTVNFGEYAQTIFMELLHQGVIVRPLVPYNMPQHLRITIGTETEMKIFFHALEKVLGKVNP